MLCTTFFRGSNWAEIDVMTDVKTETETGRDFVEACLIKNSGEKLKFL